MTVPGITLEDIARWRSPTEAALAPEESKFLNLRIFFVAELAAPVLNREQWIR